MINEDLLNKIRAMPDTTNLTCAQIDRIYEMSDDHNSFVSIADAAVKQFKIDLLRILGE